MAQNRQTESLEMTQRQTLSQAQLRFVRLLELNAPELEEAVDRELVENPALEAGDTPAETLSATTGGSATRRDDPVPAYRLRAANRSADDPVYDFSPADDSESLYDVLGRQLAERRLSPGVRRAAEYIVFNLDSNGYLRRTPAQLADDMEFDTGRPVPAGDVEEALRVVRGLEPAGVGASGLADCLELQLAALPPSRRRDDALEIVRRHFEAFSMKHMHRLVRALGGDRRRADEAVSLILTLNPKPGAALGGGAAAGAAAIVPDFTVDVDGDEITVAVNSRIPELRVEESFARAVEQLQRNAAGRADRSGARYVTSGYNDAKVFIRAIARRQQTLLDVMTAIVRLQHEYFVTQDVSRMRPMMIKDVSALTGFDASVVSRATNNKYVATPWGILPLRFFFSDTHGDTSLEFTNRELEEMITRIVKAEDKRHPLSDGKIHAMLGDMGYRLSLRTVAKYRDRLGIPVARLRRAL